ncbi:sugar transporter [Phaeovibrio sulfidiphilus]|uniref:Sugar transporter n=1 Tax=Phaeovibrio sulfidiphilus TaxID=1220600 RepID=A0A8J6YW46_9PROT|nr:sugar transporter [Phaeovibrio sulfidiphilus]MBE1236792.1 sugar transporter [Phaeovibrio sulfidiphilus]
MSSPQTTSWKAWLPVVSLSCATFIFVTTEFLPVGLLTNIARDFHKTESEVGLLLTGYAWLVALASLPLTLLAARIERRKLLLSLLVLFIGAHGLAAVASEYWMLVASRVGIALAHSVFWAITTPLAARLAPEGKKAYGLAVIVVGTSLASILGIPIGTVLGKTFHWQTAFLVVGLAAACVLVILAVLLPRLPATNAGSLRSLPHLLMRPQLMLCYLLTALAITGDFQTFTYIEPFSQEIGGYGDKTVVLILFAFGLAGIFGGYANARLTPLWPRTMMIVPLALVGVCLALIKPFATSLSGILALSVIWGVCVTIVMLALQLRIMALASDATDVAMAMFSAIFNVGIGSGALLGGVVINTLGLANVGYCGAVFLAGSVLVAVVMMRTATGPGAGTLPGTGTGTGAGAGAGSRPG